MSRLPSLPSSLSTLSLLILAAILVSSAHAQKGSQSGLRHRSPASGGQSFATFGLALREVLWERGFDAWEMEQIVYAVDDRLQQLMQDQQDGKYSLLSAASKRSGWPRISLQTRFAPFGTKLVPDRSSGDSTGPSLLRYGRSSPSESN